MLSFAKQMPRHTSGSCCCCPESIELESAKKKKKKNIVNLPQHPYKANVNGVQVFHLVSCSRCHQITPHKLCQYRNKIKLRPATTAHPVIPMPGYHLCLLALLTADDRRKYILHQTQAPAFATSPTVVLFCCINCNIWHCIRVRSRMAARGVR